jgi:hypothetical protein
MVRWAAVVALSPGPGWLGGLAVTALKFGYIAPWLSLLLVPLGLVGAGRCLVARRPRLLAVRWAALSVGAILCVGFGKADPGEGTRLAALGVVAERARPLVEAIEAFSARYGRRPSHLGELVPDFLPDIPLTGLAGYRQFQYRSRMGDYLLSVPIPKGPFDGDRLGYRPASVCHPSVMPPAKPGAWGYLDE